MCGEKGMMKVMPFVKALTHLNTATRPSNVIEAKRVQ